ncbi:AbrB family transcriptional regulator [Beijerinckia mobilis]|uniref:AbrB family transcriptional regulator n=1 Tax=Beijerinckia mobilis TaxID=231434 RepID=UPI000691C4DB|nr:AbrB family transcriptional regulator [Beijerinckia mobilis]
MTLLKSFSFLSDLSWQSTSLRWAILLALSIVFVLILHALGLPASFLLGPLLAAIFVSTFVGTVALAPLPLQFAQGIIGCMIANVVSLHILGEMGRHWPIFVLGTGSVIMVATLLGWLLTQWKILPGTTAVWGSSPGAAMAMTLMAGDFGADMRLVAFMQYLRVVCVAATTSLVARFWTLQSAETPAPKLWFPPVAWTGLIETIAFLCLCLAALRRWRIPGGPFLCSLIGGFTLQNLGLIHLELPPVLLIGSYAFIGWSIGLRFTRAILLHALYAAPRVIASIFVLIGFCGLFALLLVFLGGIDPLTAFLATSPGGADSVAIIASSSDVDMPFVMAMQIARFLIVLFTGPAIARYIAKRCEA